MGFRGLEGKLTAFDDQWGCLMGLLIRWGDSGSQVMASYMALEQGWKDPAGKTEEVKFEGMSSPLSIRYVN